MPRALQAELRPYQEEGYRWAMRLAGAGTTGSRSLAANGVAEAIKVSATEWIISGTGLT